MVDWSQGSAHPDQGASTIDIASAARPASPGADALADLAALLADRATRAWALSAVAGGRDNDAVKRASGSADVLVREADPTWAVVVRPSPDLLVFDLDECADLTLSGLCEAAEDAATAVVAVVDSGRHNCRHLWLAPPTDHARTKILETAEWLRDLHQLPATAVDERSGKTIRLPGSASLKTGANHSRVVDLDDVEVPPHTALAQARTALASVHVEVPSRSMTKVSTARPWPRTRKATRRVPSTAPLPFPERETGAHLVVDAPRAWRRRSKIDSDGWAILNDSATTDRSATATAAAWILFRHGIRSFAAARWWYQNFPAFNKFRHRDEEKATRTSSPNQWESCRQHWETVRERGVKHRPDIPAADQKVLDAARREALSLDDPLLQAAALVIIDQRFATGHGLTSRPIARRDLQLWLHLSDGTAADTIARLKSCGILSVAVSHSPSDPRTATTYNLQAGSTPVDSAHDVTNPRVPPLRTLTHPLWGLLGHPTRMAWETLSTSPTALSTRDLAAMTGLPHGDHKSGLLRLLRSLRSIGLAKSTGVGRWLRWSVPRTASLDVAAEESGATTRARELAARINAERAAWHAETRAEAGRAVRGLAVLRSRLHDADAIGSSRSSWVGRGQAPGPSAPAGIRRRGFGRARPRGSVRSVVDRGGP